MMRRLFVAGGVWAAAWCLVSATVHESTLLSSQTVASFVLSGLSIRSIGPAVTGGRIDDIAVVENDPKIIYVGTASGGLWKTVNGGTTWSPILDAEEVSSIGDVAIAPSRPDVVWVGTGEPNNRQSSSWGRGVYRSVDAGRTWKHVGLEATQHIGRIVVDPRNPDVAYVAALGHLWGPNKERGVYKTTDGGASWSRVLGINDDTGAADMVIDPTRPDTVYAATYQRRRTAFGFNGGGPGSGLYKSADGGGTWRRLTDGLPEGDTGRIGLDLYRRDPRILYATVENTAGGVFRSADAGEHWTRMNSVNPRPSYFSQIRVDPTDSQRLWLLGADLYYSQDGGKTFCASQEGPASYCTAWLERVHYDNHAMWINPADPREMLLGTDAGIYRSADRGGSWEFINSIPIGQFYAVSYDLQQPYHVYGGLQDNGSWTGPSQTLYQIGITNDDWMAVGNGDGFAPAVDPTNPDIVYTEASDQGLTRLERSSLQRRYIQPLPQPGAGEYRFAWNFPLLLSPHDPSTLYVGGNRLFTSHDRGENWSASADLTRQENASDLLIMGVRVGRGTLSGNDGQQSYGQLTTIAESPLFKGVLWVGTDDGNVQISRDGGSTWKAVGDSIPGVPRGTYVSRVVASQSDEKVAYVAFDGHRSNDFTPYLYRTADFGGSWQSIRANLPDGYTVNVIREHPRNPNLLFAGTEFGLFVSLDRGARWTAVRPMLPAVPVDDVQIHPRDNDLIIGTHGRGIYIIDDLSALEQLTSTVLEADLHVFTPRAATMYRRYNHRTNAGPGHQWFIAPNPEYGASIYYYLKRAVPETEPVHITIRDSEGTTIKTLAGERTAGLHRVMWDLRDEPPVPPTPGLRPDPPGQVASARVRAYEMGLGALVLPGVYKVELQRGSLTAERTVTVLEDPRIRLDDAALKAHRAAWRRVNGLYRSAAETRRRVLEVRRGMAGWTEPILKEKDVPDALVADVRAVAKEVDDIFARLVARRSNSEASGSLIGRLEQLRLGLNAFTGPLSPARAAHVDAIEGELTRVSRRVTELVDQRLPALSEALRPFRVTTFGSGSPPSDNR